MNDYWQEYYAKNRERLREQKHQYYLKNKNKIAKTNTLWRMGHKEQYNQKERERKERVKREVLGYYGNGKTACVVCGESRVMCLSIDHINGGGGKHRKSIWACQHGGHPFYRWLKTNCFPLGYQTLCMNCQFIKMIAQDNK